LNELFSHLIECPLIEFNVSPQFLEPSNSAQGHSDALQFNSRLKPLFQDVSFVFREDIGPHAKTSDPRLARFIADTGGSDVIELDALPPNVLQDLVKNAILSYIDTEKWNARVLQIQNEKKKLRQKLEALKLQW